MLGFTYGVSFYNRLTALNGTTRNVHTEIFAIRQRNL